MPRKRREPTPIVGRDTTLNANSRERLKAFSDRAGRLMNDIDDANADLKELFKEAKIEGFATNVLRRAIKLDRTAKTEKQKADEELLDIYLHAIQGDLFDTPKAKAS